nr:hypothetical protein Iba_chr04cCG5580 [Ipomoea batatas]
MAERTQRSLQMLVENSVRSKKQCRRIDRQREEHAVEIVEEERGPSILLKGAVTAKRKMAGNLVCCAIMKRVRLLIDSLAAESENIVLRKEKKELLIQHVGRSITRMCQIIQQANNECFIKEQAIKVATSAFDDMGETRDLGELKLKASTGHGKSKTGDQSIGGIFRNHEARISAGIF